MIGAKSSIHEGTSISDYANVYSHDHDLNDGMIVTNRHTEIGPHARITYHATVMSGVHVDEHGLLGSMGIATKDIDPFTISAGIPAKANQGENDRTAGAEGGRRLDTDRNQQGSFTAKDAKVAKQNILKCSAFAVFASFAAEVF